MKKVLVIFALLFVVLGIANAATAGGILAVSISKYEPYPAEPGKYVDVWVSVQNQGNYAVDGVQVEVVPAYPFSVDNNASGSKIVGTVLGGEKVLLQFRVRVDQNAVQGNNNFDVRYKSSTSDWNTVRLSVFVQTRDSILSVNKVYTEPERMVPGQIATVIFELENMADSYMSNINIKLDLTNATLPFAPINSTTEKRIYLMDKGETATVKFDLITSPDASSGVYKVPFVISYSDSAGTSYSKSDIIGLIVGDIPNLEVYVSNSQILSAGQAGIIELSVVNKGLTGLKFVSIKLQDSADFEKISTDSIYLGDLDSDDTDTVEFNIYVSPKAGKTIELPLTVTYLDKNNKDYTSYITPELRLYSGSEISKYGLKPSSNLGWIIVAIMLVAGGYAAYRYFWKKK